MLSENIEYSRMENIFKLTMFKSDRNAMSDYMEQLKESLETLEPDEPYLLILDVTQSGFPSVKFGLQQGNELIASFGRDRRVRILVMHDDVVMASVTKTLLMALDNIKVQFTRSQDIEEYMDWLQTGVA